MKLKDDPNQTRALTPARMLVTLTLTLALFAPSAVTQAQSIESKPAEAKSVPETYQTIYLHDVTQQNEATEVTTDLRNMIPLARIYFVSAQNAISIYGTAENIQLAQKIVADLDRNRKTYRLTYTITETDGGKRTGTQSFSLIAASGEKMFFKLGNKVPIVTGTYDAASSNANSQVQYLDVGLSIEATPSGEADGLKLRSKVEQSSLADEKSSVGQQDPVVRQTLLDGTSTLALGKPLVLGSLDIPGSTRHQEIEVIAELTN
jgi:type II secretory pathway component GspD/PulD (secretin)